MSIENVKARPRMRAPKLPGEAAASWGRPCQGDPVKSLVVPGGRQLRIRELAAVEEYRSCEGLQKLVWKHDYPLVSSLILMTTHSNGGLVIGAFAEDDELVGFACSYPSLAPAGKVHHFLQLVAVHPEFRGYRLGYELMLAHRQTTLARGLELVTWTFDPLDSVLANFYVQRLGCVVSQYLVDCFGVSRGGSNAGMPTDRVLAEWWLKTPWVTRSLAGPQGERPWLADRRINVVELDTRTGFTVCREVDLELDDPSLTMEIPQRFHELRSADAGLALAWQQVSREMLLAYFARGYRIVQFGKVERAGRDRCYYQLRRALS